MSQRRHAQTSRNFLYMLTMAMACSSSDDSVIRYVLPVLSMTSCCHITRQWGRIKADVYVSSSSPFGRTGAMSDVYDCLVLFRRSGYVEMTVVRRIVHQFTYCLLLCSVTFSAPFYGPTCNL